MKLHLGCFLLTLTMVEFLVATRASGDVDGTIGKDFAFTQAYHVVLVNLQLSLLYSYLR